MRFLQMWHGSPLPEDYVRCIESVQDRVDSEDDYVFIGDSRYIDKNLYTIDFQDYVKENIESRKDEIGELWNIYKIQVEVTPGLRQILYDFVRLFYASQNEDVFYLDTDVMLKKRPVFREKGMPYFGLIPGRSADIFLFYVNGNTKFFQELLLTSKNEIKRQDTFFRLLRGKSNSIKYLENEFYVHLSSRVLSAEDLVKLHGLKFKS